MGYKNEKEISAFAYRFDNDRFKNLLFIHLFFETDLNPSVEVYCNWVVSSFDKSFVIYKSYPIPSYCIIWSQLKKDRN